MNPTPSPFLADAAVRFALGSKILVLGGHRSEDPLWLAHKGHEVTVVDRSEAVCEGLRARAAAEGVALRVICAELSVWEPEPTEVVIAMHLHLPPDIRRAVHQRIWEQVDAKGLFVGEFSAPPYTLDLFDEDLPYGDFEILEEHPDHTLRVVCWRSLAACALLGGAP